jgi:Fic family protein
MCTWLNEDFRAGDDPTMRFSIAILKAVYAHIYIAWIHPFGDGNGRTARLIEFMLLVQASAPVPSANLLSDFYNRTRERYYRELDRISKEPFPVERFIQYAMRGFVDELRQQVGIIRQEQLRVTWENYVHEKFRDLESPARRRQKHIVLDLPQDGPPVPSAKLNLISTRVAAAYAGKGTKTITRDINALRNMGLIRRVRGGIVANSDAIRAFLPERRALEED